MINIENLSKKQIAFGKNDDELQNLMYLNKLPYMYPEIKNTLPRPANLPMLVKEGIHLKSFSSRWMMNFMITCR